MTSELLIKHAKDLSKELGPSFRGPNDGPKFMAAHAKACEFLRVFAGERSAFFEAAKKAEGYSYPHGAEVTAKMLLAFAAYLEAGLAGEITPERKAQLDVVSDLLDQANQLLETPKVHPAAFAVLIGATLEEFLRTWIETAQLSMGSRKPSIDAYVQILRDADLITKQDAKDITAWGGIRNHAAHGEWEQVESREKISLMLQGINLFMRKYERGKVV